MGITETILKTRATRSDGVVLGTLLQANRGMLLLVFNWTFLIQFGRIRSIPDLTMLIILPPTIFFLIGFIDIFMVKRMWRRDLNGWRYGIAMSILILLLTIGPFPFLFVPYPRGFLIIIIDLFAVAETIVLVTPGARRFYGT
ncbi:MAG: hypothetical protein ACXACG_16855 [Candidatus Thorarchaeota archaeon]|jgi:hypothetical protein